MSKILWTDQPVVLDYAKVEKPRDEEVVWERGVYPIGNGRLGCTAFGEPACERIQFNQDSVWVGNEDSTGGYQPFGDVYVETTHKDYSDYRRELDIERAVQTISYVCGGVKYTREYFASYPAQLLVLRFTADRPGSLSGAISMGNVHDIPIVVEDGCLVMKGDTGNFWLWRLHMEDPKRLLADRQYASEKNIALDFEVCVKVLHQGGSINASGESIAFDHCDSITLLLAAETNYVADRSKGWRSGNPHKVVCGLLSVAEKRSLENLKAEHIADYQGIFNRMSLELGNGAGGLDVPTNERRSAYEAAFRAGKAVADTDLEVLLYDYARYLMISSSRPGHGALPANLQGIWLINRRPSWRCDFHTDINIQMNYWFTQASNLADCFEPFAGWVDSIREVRKEETRKVLGVKRGWLMRSENGIFGGSTWHIQKGDSAWLCQNLWDHYTFTQDKSYLERYAYPVMKEISEFWVDHLIERPDPSGEAGRMVLVAPKGRSPEHGPVDVDGVTYDQMLCWELFTNTIKAASVLGVDEEYRKELQEKLKALLGPRIGRWGQLQEWMEDIDNPEDDHRHINHLIGLYPGSRINTENDPELAEAARVSLEARRNHGQGHPAWSRVWKACMFARLMDGESAYSQLSETLATHVFGNLWAVHPPFQIDANFGYAAAVNEMLVQSHIEEKAEAGNLKPEKKNTKVLVPGCCIHLLPALPKVWSEGRVRGMRVRGGYEVDMEWSAGRLMRAVIRGVSNEAGKCIVRCGGKTREFDVKCGGKVEIYADEML